MPTVEVLVGMIGPGKTTYARRRADEGALVVAHDDLTAMLLSDAVALEAFRSFRAAPLAIREAETREEEVRKAVRDFHLKLDQADWTEGADSGGFRKEGAAACAVVHRVEKVFGPAYEPGKELARDRREKDALKRASGYDTTRPAGAVFGYLTAHPTPDPGNGRSRDDSEKISESS